MKKVYTISLFTVIILIIAVVIAGFSGFEENKNFDLKNYQPRNEISKLISEKKQNTIFEDVNLFALTSDKSIENKLNSFVNNHILLRINKESLNRFLESKKENINLRLPVGENNFVDIEMYRVNIKKEHFKIKSLSDKREVQLNSDEGLHYRGTVKGNSTSWAAFSFFKDNVMGMIASEGGDYVLGAIQDENRNFTSNFVFYNDNDLLKGKEFVCGVNEKEDLFVRNYKNTSPKPGNNDVIRAIDTVGIYFETDHQMYLDFNGNINSLVNFVYGVFNQVATVYQNESLPIKISGIGYWQNADPYINDTDSYDILMKFGYNTQDGFGGDLAHLISTGHNQALGGIAWINVLCTPYNSQDYSGRFAFSNIEDTYIPYPTYSWTVMVIAHEMGHNFGSYHTHACHWPTSPGIVGPIDTCVVTAENSYYYYGCVPIYPQNGCVRSRMGTVMSYCHFCINFGGGISMVAGFGPLPGDTVRHWYNLASCIHYETNSSEIPIAYNLLQNYPNPFNPVTNIKYALPEEGLVTLVLYDITGREVARLVDNKFFNAGIYSHIVDANLYNMASGVYLYRINVSRGSKEVYSEIRKMVLIK